VRVNSWREFDALHSQRPCLIVIPPVPPVKASKITFVHSSGLYTRDVKDPAALADEYCLFYPNFVHL
jgi:hypothetical protein